MCAPGSFQIAESSTTPTRRPGPAKARTVQVRAPLLTATTSFIVSCAPSSACDQPQTPSRLQAAPASTITQPRERRSPCPSHKRRFSSSRPPASPRSTREIAALLGKELERQRGQIELIASENFTWPSVLEAVGSVPTNKYAEGYPGKRYYGGCEVVDEIEQLAIDRAKELFGAEHANVQPHAGAQTNMAVYMAVLQPGDTILSLRLDSRRAPHARPQGELQRAALHDRPLRRVARDDDGRLRRGAAAGEGGAAEADRLRRLCVSAHRRDRQVPRDRRRGRRAAALRHGALRRARRGRAAPESRRALRLRHVDDAQDAGGPARRLHPLPRGARAGGRPRGLPRACRAARSSTRSRRRRRASRSR